MNNFETRIAREDDVAALCQLYVENHMFHADALPDRLLPVDDKWVATGLPKAVKDILNDHNVAVFVAEVSGKIVGLVDIYLREDKTGVSRRYGYIQNLIVTKSSRRRGIGSKLVELAHQWAKDRGATEVQLEVWEFDAGPLRFYESIGYRTLKRTLVRDLSH